MQLCPLCERVKQGETVGEYRLNQLCCCARLVISARPSKLRQESMLLVIAEQRHIQAPSRDQVLRAVKEFETCQG